MLNKHWCLVTLVRLTSARSCFLLPTLTLLYYPQVHIMLNKS